MATLERIRRRSGLLIMVIGLAMLGFILTDLLGSGNSIFRGDANVVGRVNDRTVDLKEFSNKMEEREQLIRQQNPQQAQFITRKQIADGVWDEVLREELLGEQYEKLGFTVSSRELYERIKSNPNIQKAPAFQDEMSGGFSEGRLQQYITQIEENRTVDEQAREAYTQWVNFESGVRDQALQTKYNNAVQKGIYMPTGVAREMHERQNTQINANFVVQEYSTIADSTVEVDDSDLKSYYQENKDDFETEKLVDIQYVNFPISASEEDKQELQEELKMYLRPEVINSNKRNDTLPSFGMAEEDSLYAASRSDKQVQLNYYKKDELPTGLDSTIFEKEIGYVAGPYQSNGFYQLSKLTDKKIIPDSVKARHILLSFREVQNGNQNRSYQQAQQLADSLLTVVRNDTSQFAQIARNLSDDPGSGAKGGDLGWFDDQTMVRPFTKYVFRNDVGDIGMVASQFGIHIIEILDQGGGSEAVKLINISREIQPSDETLDRLYGEASGFAASVNNMDEFGSKAEEMGYQPRPVTGLKPFDENIIGIGNNREIVRWAHEEETETGDIQLFSNNNQSYVVVIVTDATEEGHRPFEAVKEQIRPKVIKELKAEQIMQRFNEAAGSQSNLQSIAQELGLRVNTQQVNFGATTLGQYGKEPKVIGIMTAMEANQLSKPIEGNRGVYIVQVLNRTPAQELPSYEQQKKQQAQALSARATNQIFESLKKEAKIEDRRAKFY